MTFNFGKMSQNKNNFNYNNINNNKIVNSNIQKNINNPNTSNKMISNNNDLNEKLNNIYSNIQSISFTSFQKSKNNSSSNNYSVVQKQAINQNPSFLNDDLINISNNTITTSQNNNSNINIIKNYNQINSNNNINQMVLVNKFYESIKENSPNLFKNNVSEKQISLKEILRLKSEAFQMLKKYHLHRKAKSKWLKRKKKLLILANNFYRNLLISRSFYGFTIISKRKSIYNIIKTNYIDFRTKELSNYLFEILIFSYKAKIKENMFFFEITKNKLKKIIQAIKSETITNKTYNKYYFAQILNNQSAIDFAKILIFLGNNQNLRKLTRYETNINELIDREELLSKKKCFDFLVKQRYVIDNNYKKIIDDFQLNNIYLNDKKKFIYALEEKIIYNYKIKYFKQKLFFMRYKNLLNIKNINNSNQIKIKNYKIQRNKILKKKIFKSIKFLMMKKKKKIEQLQIKNFMSNVKFFYYQCRKKTIESLIIEGLRQKINKYNKLLFLKILFVAKIESLKEAKVFNSVRKLHQKKFLLNKLKQNVIFNTKEAICNLKFYFRFCFKLKIKFYRKERLLNNYNSIKQFHKFYFKSFLIQMRYKKIIQNKQNNLKVNLEIINKKFFYEKTKKLIMQKKYNNIFFLRKKKILSMSIGLSLIKKNCKYELNLKKKIELMQNLKLKQYLKEMKKNISNIKLHKNKRIQIKINISNFLLKNIFETFLRNTRLNIKYKKLNTNLMNKAKIFYLKKYSDKMNIYQKMKGIERYADKYYITKRKKNLLNIMNKRYQDSIKYSMLSKRFNEYLIINSFNCLINTISKRRNNSINQYI